VSLDVSAALADPGVPRATAPGRRIARGGFATPLAGGLWMLVALLWLGTAIALLPALLPLLLFAAAFATFTLPGWPLARWLAGRRTGWLFVAPLALVFGYAAGVTIFLLLRLAGVALPLVVAAACVAVTAALAMGLPATDDPLLDVPALDRSDAAALGALLVAVGLVVAPVFAHVGLPTPPASPTAPTSSPTCSRT